MAARNQTDLKSLQEAGGWSTLVMTSRYIANAGVKLKPDAEK
jgi:hypothetical protein